MVLILNALAYATIFLVLFEQLHNLEAQERQRVLEAQTVMMSQRVEDILRAEETMRIERHDIRHRLQTVASLAQRRDYAVLVNAAVQAEQMNISMEIKIGLPEELPVDVFELYTVF